MADRIALILADFFRQMRTSVGGDHAYVMIEFFVNRNVAFPLNNLKMGVAVLNGEQRNQLAIRQNAARLQIEVLYAVGFVLPEIRIALLVPRSRFRQHRRDSPFRAHHQRSTFRGDVIGEEHVKAKYILVVLDAAALSSTFAENSGAGSRRGWIFAMQPVADLFEFL